VTGACGPGFTGVNHVGIVTRDLDRAVRAWSERYGVGPWSIYRYDGVAAMFDGRPSELSMRVGLAQVGASFRLELIEPLDERSPYAESLAKHGDADHVHHVRFDVADYDAAAGHLRGLGLASPLDASFVGSDGETAVTATYFDAADLGIVLEVAQVPDGFSMPAPSAVVPLPG
jgi:hypothetical protein